MNQNRNRPHTDAPRPSVVAQLDDDEGPFIDRTELARRLGVHARTVRRMVERGELPRPCLSAGGRPRWLWSHVVSYCHDRHLREDELDRRRTSKLR